ncbi:hypothetical protein SCLCIDRAFT_1216560 [Scleroderma citrinum Foug A]|uniref:Uncharacterized protein n=1 Tax=Scleroderma citrinum Foug A TaxID=1036808 RepID=A0A0C3DXQ8_9AGAM|nr:hypothetical protein SCLCIDRAFT_1216560 [Scleroderma citrinum Foug A]
MGQVPVNQVLVTDSICLTGCRPQAWNTPKALKFVRAHPTLDHPRLRILEGIKTGREYVLEITQLMPLLETNTRHREQSAIDKAEETRKRENVILHSQQSQGSSECLGKQLAAARGAREQEEEQVRGAQLQR